MACTCGHAEEEHGYDPKFPGSTSCTVPGCNCLGYEEEEEEEEDEEEDDE